MTRRGRISAKLSAAAILMLSSAIACLAAPPPPSGRVRVAAPRGNVAGNFFTPVPFAQPFMPFNPLWEFANPNSLSYSPAFYPMFFAPAPNYWWVSHYPLADPRQEGYNPSAGYAWDTVSTLLLKTYPANASVTLDGNELGSADSFGPFQLPLGEHTLRLEAAGFEPSETVLKVEQPLVQRLEVKLNALGQSAKPGPRP